MRLLNDKLVELRTHHDKVLAGERVMRDELVTQLKKEHETEMELSKQRNTNLELMSLTSGEPPMGIKCPDIKTESTMPDSSSSVHKKCRNQFKDDGDNPSTNDHSPSTIGGANACQRSASLTNLTDLESKEVESDASAPVRSDRMSITEMVTESMKNPVTMAAIKRELKADALTPKIQRKFAPKPPSTLPSINAVAGERSPRARGSANIISKSSDSLQ